VRTVEILIVGGWALFWICWLVAALPMKRGRVSWSRELGIRAVLWERQLERNLRRWRNGTMTTERADQNQNPNQAPAPAPAPGEQVESQAEEIAA
jgi:hypothetical protein